MIRLALCALIAACGPTAPAADTDTTPEPTGQSGGEQPMMEQGEVPPQVVGAEAPPRAKDPPAGEKAPAQPDGPPILAAHNRFRAEHCAPPLSWSKELTVVAQKWAKNLAAHGCAFEHNPDPRYGENLAYFRPPGSLSEEQVAGHWYKEIARYNFKKPTFSMEAGHFTQLVWVGTRRVGCASVECGGGELWVCNYDPPGNMMGDFDTNVRRGPCK